MIEAQQKTSRNRTKQMRHRISKVRRGVALVLVLGLLAMTLALSYATLRGQATAARLAENTGRADEARMAAESGIAAALRKIGEPTWAGVDVPLTSPVTTDSWYDVTITTGDPGLTPASPDYANYPYRLTILATGYAQDPSDLNVRSIYRIRTVVELARRKLSAVPAGWTALEPNTVYQWANRDVYTQFPVRISGQSTLTGRLNLSSEYPPENNQRELYLGDLNALRLAGKPDDRTFNGPLSMRRTRQTGSTLSELENKLGVTVVNVTTADTAPVNHPGTVATYQLYPGGKTYSPPTLQTTYGSSLQNLTLAPDPLTNPLGIYRSSGSLAINNNVNITGTIISEGSSPKIEIRGTGVSLQPLNLKIDGSTQVYQLPVAMVQDDLEIHSGSRSTIKGLALVWDEFDIRRGAQSTQFTLEGQLITAGLTVRGRDNWYLSAADWQTAYDVFQWQKSLNLPQSIHYFPTFLEAVGSMPVSPALRIRRDSTGAKYHWQTWSQPIYDKETGDAALYWNLIRWQDGV